MPQPDLVGSYWEAGAGPIPVDPSLEGEVSVDLAVIGGGFAGLSAALRAAEMGARVAVLEARHAGWGASGRNGGFCCLGGTKRSEHALIRLYGLEEARRFFDYQCEGIETVRRRLDDWAIDADVHSDGEIYLAHSASAFGTFQAEADFLETNFGFRPVIVDRDGLRQAGMAGPEFFGGLHMPQGFALNPMKYVLGLAEKARSSGVQIFGQSPVSSIRREGAGWCLEIGTGCVRASRIILAANGYADEQVPGWLHGRTLPVMSSVLVTRPLSDSELEAQGWTSDLMASDTRTLLHYFRLLPDKRFLFGTRGGIYESDAALAAMYRTARADFDRMFPAWQAVETDYGWYGHVCLSWNLTPFVGPVPDMDGVFCAMGWHGSGIAMASLSGEKAAELALGQIGPEDLPQVMSQPFTRFPAPLMRKAYLQAAYWWYGLSDRMA